MDFTLPLSLIAFLALVASWIILPSSQTEQKTMPVAAASASKA